MTTAQPAVTIWKYKIPGPPPTEWFVIEMPAHARILSLQLQDGWPHLWALVEPGPGVPRKFAICATGEDLSGMEPTDLYVGTFQVEGFVFHVFDLGYRV